MAKDWDYARLSKEASAHGGPEEFLKIIKEASYNNGLTDKQAELQPVIIGLTAGAAILGALGHSAWQKLREMWKARQEKKMIEAEYAEEAEKILIQKLHEAEAEKNDDIISQ